MQGHVARLRPCDGLRLGTQALDVKLHDIQTFSGSSPMADAIDRSWPERVGAGHRLAGLEGGQALP